MMVTSLDAAGRAVEDDLRHRKVLILSLAARSAIVDSRGRVFYLFRTIQKEGLERSRWPAGLHLARVTGADARKTGTNGNEALHERPLCRDGDGRHRH